MEMRPLRAVRDPFRKIIGTGDAMIPRYDENGVVFMGIEGFLPDPDSPDAKVL